METIQTTFTVADYCKAMERNEILVNRKYQRSPRVWPPAARSFLVETILLGFPIPKLSLYQVTDVRSRTTVKEIVDGQQRSQVFLDFYHDELRLSRALDLEDARNCMYSDLADELQQRFLEYPLAVDLFVAATPDEIRETFRRTNSYTVPLNAEEQRHARWQGEFKWFIYRLSREFDEHFLTIGAFTDNQLVRMADTKLLAEVTHALLHGISTTSKAKLDALYRDRDADFPEAEAVEARMRSTMDNLVGMTAVHNGPLMKPYHLYSLLLALSHVNGPVPEFADIFDVRAGPNEAGEANLSKLADILLNVEELSDDEKEPYREFLDASAERTNVAEQRKTRFRWFCIALTTESI